MCPVGGRQSVADQVVSSAASCLNADSSCPHLSFLSVWTLEDEVQLQVDSIVHSPVGPERKLHGGSITFMAAGRVVFMGRYETCHAVSWLSGRT